MTADANFRTTMSASQHSTSSRHVVESEKWYKSEWTYFGLKLLVNGISHPIEHAKVLIQLGYEPLEPYDSYTLFGSPARALPNVFQYMAYIRREHGLAACYAGVTPKLSSSVVSALLFMQVSRKLNSEEDFKEMDTNQEQRRRVFARRLARDALARVVAILASHPLHVLAARCMAQTVGGETRYSSISAPIALYNDNGFLGFYQGLTPRVVGELLTLSLSTLLTFIVHSYLVDDRDVRYYLSAALSYVASAITYPFQVVTTCMAVAGSGLDAATPPKMPAYEHWWHCWGDLWGSGQLARGSGLFWRFAPPTTAAAIMPMPTRRRRFSFFRRKSAKEEL